MANVKITDLTAISGADVADTDVFVIVDVNADQTKKLTRTASKIAISDANDFATYTLLNANVNTVSSNAAAVETRRVANIAGAISSVLTSDLTASRAMVSDGSGKIAIDSGVTATELGYLDATSSIQTQIDTKIATTASASNDFVTYTRLNANIDIVQDNVASASSNAISSGDTVVNTIDPIITFVANGSEAGRFTTNGNLFLGTTGASGYFLDVRGTANTGALTTPSLTLGSTLLTPTGTELNYVNGVTSAIQTQIDTKIATTASASNDFVTYTRLNANVDIVQDNVALVAANVLNNSYTSSNTAVGFIANTLPATGTLSLGTPANVVLRALGYQTGNVIIGDPTVTSPHSLDVRGTANTGALTTTSHTSTGAIEGTGGTFTGLTASRALQSDGSKGLESSATTSTELGYVSGVSSAIQTQIDTKIATTASASNDFVTYTLLNANIDIVQDNVAGILDGTTFTGEVTMNDDLIVDGNLSVHGDTITSNAINLVIQDPIVMLANGTIGSPTRDVGFLANRGNQGNAFFGYDESYQAFTLAETKDPVTNVTIHPTSLANLVIANLTTTSLTIGSTLLTPTGTELNYVDGVTSAIQTQIDTVSANVDTAPTQAEYTTSTINSYPIAVSTSSINKTQVYLDGIYQNKSQYVLANSSSNIQFKIAALVADLSLEIITDF